MEFSIKRDNLSRELGALAAVPLKNSPLPILECVHIEALAGHRLRLTATSLQSTLTCEVQADSVVEEGAVCVTVRRLADLVRLMPEGLLTVSTDAQDYLVVKGQRSRHRLPAMSADAWPPQAVPAPDALWTEVPAGRLRALLKGVEFAVAPEEDSKFNLRGVKMEIEGNRMRMVATDGHRLSMAESGLDVLTLADADVLVPEHGTQDLARLLGDEEPEQMVGVAASANKLFFRAGARLLAVTLLVGEFPEYRGILKEYGKYTSAANFPADDLNGAVRRALLAADGKSAAVRFRFDAGMLVIRAQTQESGEAEEFLVSDWTGEDGAHLSVNAKFLLEFLSAVQDVRWECGGPRDALHLVGTNKEGLQVRYVLMPLDVPE
jgi:DNA polymerase-3 subunit beta